MYKRQEYIWYRDKASTPFHFYNDNQQWLQMDKFGHSFSAYRESQLAYHAMRWAGFSKKKALIYGGSMGFFLQLPIDIWDGLNAVSYTHLDVYKRQVISFIVGRPGNRFSEL